MRDKHPLAGKTVLLNLRGGHIQIQSGDHYRIEDWWENVGGKKWGDCDGNPACIIYGFRAGKAGIPPDDEVVYGKVGPFGHLIHVSELGDEVKEGHVI